MMRVMLCLAMMALGCTSLALADGEPAVAVVYGEYSYKDSPEGEGANARTFCDTVQAALDEVGVSYAKLTDADVEKGGLSAYRVAIFPYNFVIPETEEQAILRYLDSGGKAFFFYAIPASVSERIGVRHLEHANGDYQTIRLPARGFQGLPPSVAQASWNIERVEASAPDARVIGEWYNARAERLSDPAVIVSPRGGYMSHVLTDVDLPAKGRMLLSILGWLAPEVWPQAAQLAVAAASEKLEAVSIRLRDADLPEGDKRSLESKITGGRNSLRAAERLAHQGRYAAAVTAAGEVSEQALLIYGLTSPERLNEFRAVWIHDAYGVPGRWGWERSIRELKEHGFNAIIANMLWAGLAHYPSGILPVSPQVAERGDQIADALRWCKQYGIELHVWKVNYNLLTAPPEFVEQMRKEGRLQRHPDGSEVLWLCPSDPRNLELERDSMLEVVRKYDVAGIHFDYIRYPDDETCYCDGCRQRFEEAIGAKISDWPAEVMRDPLKPKWDQWRRDQITRLVRAVSSEARRIRPGIMISAAVFDYPDSLDWVNQDWKVWMDEGLLDFVCPMDYTADPGELEGIVSRQVQLVQGKIPLYPGIGEFIIPDTRILLGQMERARRLGADGFTLFCYEHVAADPTRLDTLHASHTAHATTPPHPSPRLWCEFPEGLPGHPDLCYLADTPITMKVALTTAGNYGSPIVSALGHLRVETTEGVKMFDLDQRSSEEPEPLTLALQLPPGRYRLAASGTATLVDGSRREFLVRSRPFEVVAPP